MSIVIDASATVPWGFVDEADGLSDALLDRVARDGAVVPAIWLYEMASVLAVGIRRGRIAPRDARDFIRFLLKLSLKIEASPQIGDIGSMLGIADRQDISAYDAAYLLCAKRSHLALATRDKRLAAVARRSGVAVV